MTLKKNSGEEGEAAMVIVTLITIMTTTKIVVVIVAPKTVAEAEGTIAEAAVVLMMVSTPFSVAEARLLPALLTPEPKPKCAPWRLKSCR